MQRPSHRYFAENLRRECSRFRSIAEVCRGTGINRQQFNKYLSGKYLPNQRTRKRISQFLKVPEEELFRPPAAHSPADVGLGKTSQIWSRDKIAAIVNAAGLLFPGSSHKSNSVIADGYYFCYFPMPHHREMLVRSLVKITTSQGITSFVRHTFFNTPSLGVGFASRGRHRGVVMSWGSEIYFLALNSFEPLHASLMVFSNNTGLMGSDGTRVNSILVGLALTRGLSDPYSCRVCLEYIGDDRSSVKSKFSLVGMARFSEASVQPLVGTVMSPLTETVPKVLDFPVFEQIISASHAPAHKKKKARAQRP